MPPVFRGWRVVAGVFVVLATTSGFGFYDLTLYLRALTEERGFSVGSVSGATALFFAVSGVTGVGVASLLARFDARIVMAGGATLAACALWALGRVETLTQLYAAYALFALGYAGCALVPGTTLVTRWFHRRRAAALAVASTGLSVGGIGLTQLSAHWIERGGLASAMPAISAVFWLGTVPAIWLLVSPDPRSHGLAPDGDPAPEAGARAAGLAGAPFGAAVRSRFFRYLTAAYVLVFLGQVGALAHLSPLVTERAGRAPAALAVSCVAAASIVGRLAGAWLATRVALRAFTVLLAVVQTGALAGLATARGTTSALAVSTVLGVTVGNLLMLHPLLVAEAFGVRDYPRIFSTSQLVTTLGVAGGPLVLGLLHDAAGGYATSYGFAAAGSLAAGGLLWLAGPLPEVAEAGTLGPDPVGPDAT